MSGARHQRRTIRTLSHCFYDCKYHIVWTPKYRGKILKDNYTKQEVARIIKIVCKWKGFEVMELNIQDDHIHAIFLVSPRYSISYTMQIIKGKSSTWIKKKNKKIDKLCHQGSLWARGYFVSTIGIDEHIINRYVKHQSHHNQLEQPKLFNL